MRVQVDEVVRVDIKLSVGSNAETVTVTAVVRSRHDDRDTQSCCRPDSGLKNCR